MLKRLSFIAVLLLSTYAGTFAALRNDTLKINPKTDLEKLCKVWGLLKYHHPEVIKGKFDWDNELIKILPTYNKAKDEDEANLLLLQWIKNLGDVPATNPVPDSIRLNAKMKPDLSWINQSSFSKELTSLLTQISNYHVKEKQHYVNVQGEDGVYIFAFTKEDAYAKMAYPDLSYRLLAAFRYWNMIEYWNPYKDLAKSQWPSVLPSFIADAIRAKDESAYVLMVQKMASCIQDSHAVVIAKQGEVMKGLWKMPFNVKFILGKPIVNAVNSKMLGGVPIAVGDVLNSVNSKKTTAIASEHLGYISASNEAVVRREVAKLLTRTKDSVSKVSITNKAGKTQEYVVKNMKYNMAEPAVFEFSYQKDSTFFVMPSGVLYLNPATIKAAQVASITALLKSPSVKGIVVDTRIYPKGGSGNLVAIAEQSLLSTKVNFAKFSSAVFGYPGYFAFTEPMSLGKENPTRFKGKVAILVNEQTQSAAEFLAMIYQAIPGAIVVGSTTAGADGNVVATFALPGGIYTTYTGLGVFYPDGKPTQQVGIVPNIRVNQTINGFRAGKDEVLDAAVKAIVK